MIKGSKKVPYLDRVCRFCNKAYKAADGKGCICYECKEPKPCRCGCGKLAPGLGSGYVQGHKSRGKTYTEIYGTPNPKCGFKKGNQYNTILVKKKFGFNEVNSIGERFRSKFEVQVSELLLKNGFQYTTEVVYPLVDGGNKIVDFQVGDVLIEVSGYAYEGWRRDFQEKVTRLMKSTSRPLLIITYQENSKFIRPLYHRDVFIEFMENPDGIIKKLQLLQGIVNFNRDVLGDRRVS